MAGPLQPPLDTSSEKQRERALKRHHPSRFPDDGLTLKDRMRRWRLEKEVELGVSLKAPRPLNLAEVRELAQLHAPEAVETLHEVHTDVACAPAARVVAANALLDRGYGKPVQGVQQLDREGNPTDPAAINVMVLAAQKLDTDELRVLVALYRKMGVRLPGEAPVLESDDEP